MLKAVLLGALVAVILSYGHTALADFIRVSTSEDLNIWLGLLSLPGQAFLVLTPGFVAGWFAQRRGIVAGFAACLLGNLSYSVLSSESTWRTVLDGSASQILDMSAWIALVAISWALYGAVAGGTAQLLRSNKVLQATRETRAPEH